MPGRSRKQRVVPNLPDLPDEFDPAPDAIETGAAWYGVGADASLSLPERMYDLHLAECVWRDVDASSRRFSGLVCRDVLFEHCDFSGAVLDSAGLTRVRFLGCRLTGIVLSGATLNDVLIEGGAANLANFRISTATLLHVRDTSMSGADLYGATLRECAFLDCDLRGIDLSNARIDGLSLHGSTLDSIRGTSSLADAGLRVETDQVVPLGLALVAGLGVAVGPRPGESAD